MGGSSHGVRPPVWGIPLGPPPPPSELAVGRNGADPYGVGYGSLDVRSGAWGGHMGGAEPDSRPRRLSFLIDDASHDGAEVVLPPEPGSMHARDAGNMDADGEDYGQGPDDADHGSVHAE